MLQSFAGGHLFGTAWGRRPAGVLALHGWQRTHRDFDAVFDDPAFTAPAGAAAPLGVIGVDLPGFGATPDPPEAWGTVEYARHLLPMFEGDELAGRVTLVGHSFGGRVAVRLATLVPDRVERLVLTGVPLLDKEGRRVAPPLGYRMGRRLHRIGLVNETRMEALRQRYGSADYRAARGVVRGVLVTTLAEQYTDDMASIRCPVDLVWGADDTEVPVEVAERAASVFPAATLHLLPGVGHLVPIEAPAELRRLIVGAATRGDSGPT